MYSVFGFRSIKLLYKLVFKKLKNNGNSFWMSLLSDVLKKTLIIGHFIVPITIILCLNVYCTFQFTKHFHT